MKKTYQRPTMAVVHIATEEMVAASTPGVRYSSQKVDTEGTALSKGRSIWDDNGTNRSLW